MRLLKLASAAAAAFLALACSGATESNQSANTNERTTNVAANTTPAKPAATPDEFAAVRGVYAQHCQRCHQPDGAGGEFTEEGLKPLKVPALRSGSAVRHTDEQLTRKITNGDVDEGMPAFKSKLTPEQINELVRFIRVEFQRQTSATGGANASQPVPNR